MGLTAKGLDEIEWRVESAPVGYPEAVASMDARVEAIRAGRAPETIWLLEHPPLYTAGTSSRPEDLLPTATLPVFTTGRGGQFTYHGPGQRIAYVMLDLRRRGQDVRGYVRALEAWIIAALAELGVTGERRDGRVGIWVDRGPHPLGGRREDKIAAIGVRIRHWITFHGLSLNVTCDLAPFAGIVPCGIAEPQFGVTSLLQLRGSATLAEADRALRHTCRF
ncbi:MAG: lipoyl(octanoyl) transferase LipB [Alphaproteobacteria bacterium]|nr:lipoyl(octanoyl) transferase LipB [Alphaproteobacteria bacterium]